MKLVQAMLAVVLAGTMGSAAADDPEDYPEDYYLGDLLVAGNGGVDIDNTIDESGTSFADVYSFDIGSSMAEVKVTLQFDSSDDVAVFDSSNFAITLKDTNGVQYAYDDIFNGGALELAAILAPSAVGTGFYQFVVSGSAGGIDDEYEYEGALSAAPVPEPKGWMLMLAGFGLVGFMMSRRRQA